MKKNTKGTIYGYIRVSTVAQRDDRQWMALAEFGIPKKCIFVDKQSGKDFDRPAYTKMMKRLGHGDTLVVKSLDRLGRNYDEMTRQLDIITKEKEAARARGVTLGRKPMAKPAGFPAIHAQWEAGKVSARKAAEALGVSTPTFLKWANASTDA